PAVRRTAGAPPSGGPARRVDDLGGSWRASAPAAGWVHGTRGRTRRIDAARVARAASALAARPRARRRRVDAPHQLPGNGPRTPQPGDDRPPVRRARRAAARAQRRAPRGRVRAAAPGDAAVHRHARGGAARRRPRARRSRAVPRDGRRRTLGPRGRELGRGRVPRRRPRPPPRAAHQRAAADAAPDGLAPRIANLAEWGGHVRRRVRRQLERTGDPALAALLAEVEGYLPPPDHGHEDRVAAGDAVVPLRLATPDGELAFLYTMTVFGSPRDVTLDEIAIESFFPADDATAAALGVAR